MSSNHGEKDLYDVKYSEIVSMTDLAPCDNGNGSIGGPSDSDYGGDGSVCPLHTKVSLSDSGIPTMASVPHQSKEYLNGDVAYKAKSKYNTRVKVLAAVAGVMTIATIVLAILLGTSQSSSSTSSSLSEPSFCTSQECITAASRILNSMDFSVNPCEDFFTYSCGKWNKDHVIPEDKSSVSTFNDVRDGVSLALKEVLETSSSGDRDSIKKSKNMYASCMDTSQIDSLNGNPALDLIADFGGMPLFGDSLTNFNFETAIARSDGNFATGSIVSMWVSSDDMNSSLNIIQVDQPSFGMPNRDYYLDEDKRNATLPGYRTFMVDYLSKLWQEKDSTSYNRADVETVADQIIDLETQLAAITQPSEERRDSFAIYRKRTIEEMGSAINSDFDWHKYLTEAFNFVGKTIESTRDMVSYGDPYFQNFTKILAPFDDELLQNYIGWKILKSRISYLGKEYRDTEAPYRLAVSGTSVERARWQTCSDNANSYFPMPVGALFVQAKFPERNKKVTETMVENIRESFIGFLPGNEWMDQPTKDEAEKKANMITPIIAYPDYILEEDNPKMDEEYEDATITPDQYFASMQNLNFFNSKKNLKKLDVPVDREEWITGPAIVNAFYSPTRNQIVFPAGILQPPFYDQGQPNSMNYGGIGMVIGHEITHGFDDSGSQYNEIGNLEDWWSKDSRTEFEKKAKCIEDQYSGYYWEDAETYINGKQTLGENIADNGGIREAFDAYQTWTQNNDADIVLPGLGNFTQEQLFFLSMAQVWCGKYRPEYAVRLAATDNHSPGIYRVIGSLSNFEEFGKAYQCKQGLNEMYPEEEDTCRVW